MRLPENALTYRSAESRTAPEILPTPTAADATEVKGLGVRTASPMNITLTKHHSALAARKRSNGVRPIWCGSSAIATKVRPVSDAPAPTIPI
jgi:hypothetical protein